MRGGKTQLKARNRREELDALKRRLEVLKLYNRLLFEGLRLTAIPGEIARRLGISRSTVSRQLAGAGVDLRKECAKEAAWTVERLLELLQPLAQAPFEEAFDFDGDRITLKPAHAMTPKTRRALAQSIKSIELAPAQGDAKLLQKFRRIAKTKNIAALGELMNEVAAEGAPVGRLELVKFGLVDRAAAIDMLIKLTTGYKPTKVEMTADEALQELARMLGVPVDELRALTQAGVTSSVPDGERRY
jgi:DNA-binding transcriptional ArsR family regulator